MKKCQNFIILLIITLLLFPLRVYADECGSYCNSWMGSIGEADYETNPPPTVINNTSCGSELFCFGGDGDTNSLSGNGVFLKIIKYGDDKTEKIIGTPVLLFSGNFTSTIITVQKKGSEAKLASVNGTTVGSCEYRYDILFESEELVEFQKSGIKYYIDDTTITSNITTIEDKNLPSATSGELADYIRTTVIKEYFSTPSKVKNKFKLSDSEYSNFIQEMDKYYFAIEPAKRYAGGVGSTVIRTTTRDNIITKTSTTQTNRWYCASTGTYRNQWGKPTTECGTKYVCEGNSAYSSSDYNTCNNGCKANTSNGCVTYSGWVNTGKVTVCDPYTRTYAQHLKVNIYSGTSYIKPARYTSDIKLIASIVTPKDETDCNTSTENGYPNCVKRPVYIEDKETGENVHATDSNGEKMYEYYIGPTLKKALVGEGTDNKYKLWSSDIKLTESNLSTYKSQKYAIGVSYWWFPKIISCKNVCNIANKTSDQLLSCAEQFCDNATGYDDRMNTQKEKYSCITCMCEYEYEPMTCDLNKTPNANIYAREENYNSNEVNQSTCSILNSDGTTKTENNSKTITTCEVYDENKKIFDQNTYLVVACKESSAFQYADLSKTKIVAGEGLNYFANLHGGKECTVSFDIDTWKVAYASYHSEDKVCLNGSVDASGNCIGGTVVSPRKLLENMLNYYNKCSLGVVNDEETKKLCDIGGDAIGINMDGTPVTTTWESLGYNTSKVEVKTQVTEIIDNEKVKSDSYTLIENKNKTDNSIVATTEKDAYSFAANKKISFGKVKTYLSTSNVEANYTFDKYCVTTNGKATIYKASADGKCKQDETTIESKEVLGKNVYFTSLKATPNSEITSNDKHAIEYTNVTVKNENDITYLTGQEYCPYKIEDIGLSCSIEIELMDSTTAHGSDIYDGNVKAKLRINNQLGTKDSIVGTKISYKKCESDVNDVEDDTEISISMCNTKNGAEIKDIYGIVTTKNGETVTCDKKIKLINPGNACSINKVEDNLYEIVTSYPGQTYYALTYDIKLHKEFTTYPQKAGFKAILKENGKNYVRVNEQSKSSRLYGAVIGSSGGYEVCWTDIGGDEEHPQCKTQCTNRFSAIEVQTFCNANWHNDVDNYSSYSDCVTNCKINCPKELTCDINKIQEYCKNNHNKYGTLSVSECINHMYNECNCSGTDYIYRPVNNSNPFPNSYESPIPGDRIIGGNWVGKTHYITEDNGDETSVTGNYASNGKAEYEITLTAENIRDIRKNTEAYMSEGKNPYLDYIGVEPGTDGYCLEEGYCSEFINSSEFSVLFKIG